MGGFIDVEKKICFVSYGFRVGGGSLVATSTTAQAKSKYVTTPTSIRGKWFYGKNETGQYLNITKYTFYVVNYTHGKKDRKGDMVSGKKNVPHLNYK